MSWRGVAKRGRGRGRGRGRARARARARGQVGRGGGGEWGGGVHIFVYAYNIMFIPCLRSDAVSGMSAHLLSIQYLFMPCL